MEDKKMEKHRIEDDKLENVTGGNGYISLKEVTCPACGAVFIVEDNAEQILATCPICGYDV